jgi:Zn-dependent peptidase ImmA (M78 family)
VELISSSLGFPEDFFFISEYYYSPITPFHRKRASLAKKSLESAEATANLRRIHLKKLLQAVDIDGSIPKLSIDEYDSPQKIAQVVRKYFSLPHGPILNIVDILEDKGVFIFLEEFDSIQLSGFTLIENGSQPPIIFVNKNAPGDMERLTIAHELGHIVMHDVLNEHIEEEAWAFAAEFMMPECDIYDDLRRAKTIHDFSLLKRKWKISMSALIRRSKDLSILTENQYRYWMQKMAPYRKKEPVQVPQEKPSLYRELINTYKEELNYSKEELCKILSINKEMYDEMYEEKENRIRLVANSRSVRGS